MCSDYMYTIVPLPLIPNVITFKTLEYNPIQ